MSDIDGNGKTEPADAYIYCQDCQLAFLDGCLIHPLNPVAHSQVERNIDESALKTLPGGLSLVKSEIPGEVNGVFADVVFPQYTKFGPYEGEKKVCEDENVPGFGWLVSGESGPSYFLDAEDVNKSNWMRYVKCARTKKDQNLEVFQYRGQIYYKTIRNVDQGEELLIWYGDDYADELGLDKDEYNSSVVSVSNEVKNTCRSGDYSGGQCEATFEKKLDHTKHMEGHGSSTPSGAAKSSQLATVEKLDYHQCSQCEYKTTRKARLDRHMSTHSSTKPHRCRRTVETNQPRLVKTRVKKNQNCAECNFTSVELSDLRKHMRTHTGEKPFKCVECNYEAAQKGNLVSHMRKHTGERPYKCSKCNYGAKRLAHLEGHMRMHTGEKPYKCTKCPYGSANEYNLLRHMRIHTGDKPYRCSRCEYKSSDRSTLRTHLKSIHRVSISELNASLAHARLTKS